MNTPLRARLASFVLASIVTMAMLLGVETLATQDEAGAILGQTQATKKA